jgi:hypothetical protein
MLLSQRPRQPALIAQARLTLLVMLALPGVAMMCMPPVRMTPPSADASAEEVALSGAAAMIGAGDIGVCDGTGDDSTAAIVDSVLKADSVAVQPRSWRQGSWQDPGHCENGRGSRVDKPRRIN